MYGASKSAAHEQAEAAIAAFQLESFADRNIGTYSGGQRRRLDVALGVIHSPQVVFLDEPTVGLDPPSRARMWQEVRRLRDGGMTIFLTTHYLDEADALCDRISIIDAGLIVAEGTPSDLKHEISGDVVIVDLATTAGAPEPATVLEAAKILAEQPCVESCETIEHTLRLYVDGAATAVPLVMRALNTKGIEPGAIETRRPSLDDVFLAKTGRTLAE
jgi:ABC-2 type transport system ATP-binding protein